MSVSRPKNILITGAARGIGRATARHLLSLPAQHRLYLLDTDASELAYCSNIHLSSFAPRVSHGTANVRDIDEIRRAVKHAAESFFKGRIDVVVNNAGIARSYFTQGDGTMESWETMAEWNAYIETNLTAPFAVSQACVPYMKKATPAGSQESKDATSERLAEGGCIVHVSSFRAHASDPNCEGYAATKAGLIGLTHAMATSGAQWGIRCNVVSPGWVSVQHECREGDEAASKIGGRGEDGKSRMQTWASNHNSKEHELHPVGRVGRGEDIAEAIEYLMNAGFVSGQEVVVDGGISGRKNPDV